MSQLTVRTASTADAATLLEIYRPYVEDTAITFEVTPPTQQQFAERIANTLKRYPYLVAELDGQPVGYAYAGPYKGREAYDWSVEMSIYVAGRHQGQGIGRALYTELERLLALQGVQNCYACVACTPRSDDPYLSGGSMSFHEHMGYEPVCTFRKCAYKLGLWYDIAWMEKMLGRHEEAPQPFVPFPEL